MRPEEILRLLPEVLQQGEGPGSVLSVLLECMEQLHHPIEQQLDNLHEIFDPERTPESFVPYLGSWLDLERIFGPKADHTNTQSLPRATRMETQTLRALASMAAELSSLRGTARGLVCFLEVATGLRGFRVRSCDEADPYRIEVVAPMGARSVRSLIALIIEQEKPAHVVLERILWEGDEPP